MSLPNTPNPQLPQKNRVPEERGNTEVTQKKFCELQSSIESKVLTENSFLDKKILEFLNLKEYPANSNEKNIRFKLVKQLYNAGIRLFDSDEDNNDEQISDYSGSFQENMILFSFINEFGNTIINKENYIKELQGESTPTLLNGLSDDWSNYEKIDEWIEKYKNCKKPKK